MPISHSPLSRFTQSLRAASNPRAEIKAGLIGGDILMDTPNGPKPLIYADYVASGRALRQIEDFMLTEVLPTYANSHSEDSYVGAYTTELREEARATVARLCGADPRDHAVIFAGSGATAGLNRLVHLFGIREALAAGKAVTVLVGPYEHHSNLLPWRESGAQVIELAEAVGGGVDMADLQARLADATARGLTIAAISAASNVTGICADVATVTRAVKAAGALMVWDYAGGGPYLPISMTPAPDAKIDAIALSPHKFIGGPGASGVLLLRRDAACAEIPSHPGGGTVTFVNRHRHDYSARLEDREEGGTPNILGDIRAALAMIVKDVIGQEYMTARNAELTARAFAALDDVPNLTVLASQQSNRLPIFSFIFNIPGFHHGDVTRALSERFGVQVRGGCSCAGPYVHRLLGIGDFRSEALRVEVLSGDLSHKPGFVRFNLSVLMDDATVDHILKAIAEIARDARARAAA